MRLPTKKEVIAARDWLIYVTNKTWGAFLAVIALTLVYIVWNWIAPSVDRFDPAPFIGLGVVYTIASLWQNYLLLIQGHEQKLHSEKQESAAARQDAVNTQMLKTILHIAEAMRDHIIEKDGH